MPKTVATPTRIAKVLTAWLLFRHETGAAKVNAASQIAWFAAQQNISPDDLTDAQAREFFDTAEGLALQSRNLEGLELDARIGTTSLGRRWRVIRLLALRGLL
jgi:hypothetical protein